MLSIIQMNKLKEALPFEQASKRDSNRSKTGKKLLHAVQLAIGDLFCCKVSALDLHQ